MKLQKETEGAGLPGVIQALRGLDLCLLRCMKPWDGFISADSGEKETQVDRPRGLSMGRETHEAADLLDGGADCPARLRSPIPERADSKPSV